MLRDKLNGMTEVAHLKDEKAGELFLDTANASPPAFPLYAGADLRASWG